MGETVVTQERTTTNTGGIDEIADDGVSESTANSGDVFKLERRHTRPGIDPFDEIEWQIRSAIISNEKGETVFEQKNVEVPTFWTQLATNVVANKYFHGPMDSPKRESSVKQLVGRVAKTIRRWGQDGHYFSSDDEAETFEAELKYLLVHQHAAFNSPVWFNCGIEEHPQCSACFINSVEDTMSSILDLAKTEGMLFKWGSGTGSNMSTIRSSREGLGGGGEASGPVSFMRGFDAFAGVIKSGGKTRRAAKMVILDADHPDVKEFIDCKSLEEKKAWALIEAGYEGGFNVPGGAYDSIQYQNANHSVRATDGFMNAVEADGAWKTHYVTSGEEADSWKARDLMHAIADATHVCGDPGMQFDTIINRWHTCPETARINASNPCSEYMFLDNSACNLSSLNLLKFRNDDGSFKIEDFKAAVHVLITAMEIIVGSASYPTEAIGKHSQDFRPLGLGFANLGAFLMSRGMPYDSSGGRAFAGVVTAIMTGQAYKTSAEIASRVGPFEGFFKNRKPMLKVIKMHGEQVENIEDLNSLSVNLVTAANQVWQDACDLGSEHGFRNAQASVVAPTGTIAFMMDCDTTGIEPDIALVKYKKLVGGGALKIVNNTVPSALKQLGYDQKTIDNILAFIEENDTIEGAPDLKEEHLAVFDCAFKPSNGERSIHHMGHIRMMAAVQPFISGAISKTVNMPNEATVEEIEQTYMEAWKFGLKSIAIYRDGCKRSQPLSTARLEDDSGELIERRRPVRRRLPDERPAITHKFSVAGHEGYITVGMYDDGTPGELFITMAKEGTVVSGLMDGFATAISMNLQYGVPLQILVNKFSHSRFEPAGFTNNPAIPMAKSILDYIFRWLGLRFLPAEDQPLDTEGEGNLLAKVPIVGTAQTKLRLRTPTQELTATEQSEKKVFQNQADAPPCPDCGTIMIRNGMCYKCLDCGATSGCS